MTIEDRYVVDLGDIRSIRFDCRCGASVVFKIAEWEKVPSQCPGCAASWHHGIDTEPFATFNRFRVGLKNTISIMQKEESPMRMRFELDRPRG